MTPQTDRLNTALDGRYRIIRNHGDGGIAIVCLAKDVRHDRQFAFKVLRAELAQAFGHERLLREIKVAARLDCADCQRT